MGKRKITQRRRREQASRRHLGRPAVISALSGVIVAAIVVALLFVVLGLSPLAGDGGEDAAPRAAIVDQLSLSAPNPEFVGEATSLLHGNGYEVDYFPGEEVTVDLYRKLPKGGYDLLILRVHSTADISRGEEDVTSVSLFTGQPYSPDQYYEEQLQGRIGFAQYTEESPKLFGITSEFVRESMEGEFDDTVVIMMGCQGFINAQGAEAFEEKGARGFIGWDGLVSAQHTDEATALLLRHLVDGEAEPGVAIAQTMATVGPDPSFGSRLIARP